MKNIIRFLKENMAEIFYILGMFFIILTTFLINIKAGMYTLGVALVLNGLFLARCPTKKKKGTY